MANSVVIIAEVGVNHNGRMDYAKQLVDAAAEAGADYVKFQVFNADGTEEMITATQDGGVVLYHNDEEKLSTTSAGVNVTGVLNCTGDIVAFVSSDSRLKDNIKPIDNALDKIMGISGNTYDWNSASTNKGSDTGVIAQEVEALGLPGVVTTRDNGYKAVRYERLVPLLIEAIKELNAKVEDLEDKLSDK